MRLVRLASFSASWPRIVVLRLLHIFRNKSRWSDTVVLLLQHPTVTFRASASRRDIAAGRRWLG